ncbi:hypothetical protein VP01_2570g2 [Puccinia sorghi]|uniref:Uncharacterized protein n=1 Tax=Puccinia sorghi TaxID=27349 RepID=A0A0L6V5L1_9BASI|nr:hypothetical protein VP01_2570g2 [Puccinia sorghi]
MSSCSLPLLHPSKKFRSMDKLVRFVIFWVRNHGYGIRKLCSHTEADSKFSRNATPPPASLNARPGDRLNLQSQVLNFRLMTSVELI